MRPLARYPNHISSDLSPTMRLCRRISVAICDACEAWQISVLKAWEPCYCYRRCVCAGGCLTRSCIGAASVGDRDLEGKTIRRLRTGRGLTQGQLAEILDVGQGTVSRWERSIERPRPRYVAALRDLFLRDDEARFRSRCMALMRNNLVAAGLMDVKTGCRLSSISSLGAQHYLRKHGIDIRRQIGTITMESHADRVGLPEWWEAMAASGLLKGEAIAARMAMNIRGQGHVTLYEPIMDEGEVVAVFCALQKELVLPDNDEVSLERFDVLHADSPDRLLSLHGGERAAFFDPDTE